MLATTLMTTTMPGKKRVAGWSAAKGTDFFIRKDCNIRKSKMDTDKSKDCFSNPNCQNQKATKKF